MRSHSIIIHRIRCGLSITDEETIYIEKWIADRKKSNERFIDGMMMFFLAVVVTGGIIAWINNL